MRTTIIAAICSAAIATVASFTIASAERSVGPTARASADPVVAQLRAINRNITLLRRQSYFHMSRLNRTLGTYGGRHTVTDELYRICNLLTTQASVYC